MRFSDSCFQFARSLFRRGFERQVPFIHHDDHRAAGLLRVPRDVGIARGHSGACVHDQQRNVGLFEMPPRHDHAQFLSDEFCLALAANPGRVHEAIGTLPAAHDGVHGVARGSRHVGDDRALRARQPIEHCRFPDVGPPDDRDVDLAGRFRLFRWGRTIFKVPGCGLYLEPARSGDGVEQFVDAVTVFRRNGKHVVRKLVERRRERFLHLRIDFVCDDRQRLASAAQ